MKTIRTLLVCLTCTLLLHTCVSKSVNLLARKWDCIQVENLVPPGTKFLSAEDSVNAVMLGSVVNKLNWNFTSNMRYQCSVNNTVTDEGTYKLLEDDKILECTPETGKRVNRYVIQSLTEYELVLLAQAETNTLTIRFKPR